MTNCPNCRIELENNACKKCGYSFAPKAPAPKRKNAKVQEINSFIKTNLLKLRINPEEAGEWVRKWATMPKANYVSGHQYRGVNRFITAFATDDFFLTRKQIIKLGGTLKDKAMRYPIIFWMPPDVPKEQDGDGEVSEKKVRTYPIMNMYWVYEQHDVEGIKYKDYVVNREIKEPKELLDFIRSKGATVEFRGSRACFDTATKSIIVPSSGRFESDDELVITVCHEFAHWCIDKIRGKDAERVKDIKTHDREEVAAEITALYIASMFGVYPNENSVRYINHWLEVAEKDDYSYISAMQTAEKVLDFINKGEI